MNPEQTVGGVRGVGQPYRKLKLEIAQAGTAAPTLTREFINELNFNKVTPTLARTSAGLYTLTMAGAFQGVIFPLAQIMGGATGFSVTVEKTSANVLTVRVFDAAAAAADLVGTLFLSVEVHQL